MLAGTDWVLTAGHVVCYENSNIAYQPGDYTVWFDTPNGRIGEAVTQIVVCPTFDGNPLDGGDIAMVKLANVPEGVTGYQLYTGPDALNQVYQEYGYGAIGLMSSWLWPTTYKDIKHTGENEFEVTGTMLGAYLGEYVAPSILLADADSGSPAQDAFGQMFGINNLGLGINEACAAPGDSGGPAFVDGEIAGTADFGMSSPADIDAPKIDATYGEIIGWVNVSSFASWINSVSASSGTEYLVNSNDVGVDPATGNQLTIDNQSDNQSHSSVAMDALGDYTIVWTSYGHDGGSGLNGASYNGENGVFAKRLLCERLGEKHHVPGESNHRGQPAGRPRGDGRQRRLRRRLGEQLGQRLRHLCPPLRLDCHGRIPAERLEPESSVLHAVRHEPVVRAQRRKRR